MFNLKRLKEVAKPETIEERRSRIVHETHLDAIVDKAIKELEDSKIHIVAAIGNEDFLDKINLSDI